MKALRHISLLFSLLTVILFSCTKDRHERGCADQVFNQCLVDSSRTHIRIYNTTNFPLCDFKLYTNVKDTTKNVTFGYVPPNEFTCYMAVDSTILGAAVGFKVGSEDFKSEFLSNSKHKSPKSFVTYNVYLAETVDTVNKQIIFHWKPSQIPIVDQY